jgi:hypothetical protein
MLRAVASALVALALGTAAAPAIAVDGQAIAPTRRATPEDRYALAGGCYTVRAAGGDASLVDGPVHFHATSLGRYLLYTRDEQYLAADGAGLPGLVAELVVGRGGDTVVAGDKPTPFGTWEIVADGAQPDARDPRAFRITLPATGQAVVAAKDHLELVAPSHAGERGRFTFHLAEGCAPWPEVEVNVAGQPAKGASPTADVRGLLEAHMHGMAFESFGGRAHCGRPWHPYGVTRALVDCPDHYPANGAGAVFENILNGNPAGTHDPVGWPTFRDWPAPRSLTHEQSYYRWIERAWRGGLRIFVNLLVDNHALCAIYPLKHNSCNEMDGARLQARRLHEMQDYIDAQSGGPGEGWYRIVDDPFEARQVINDGKLAVVMGIEVSLPFDCGEYLDVPRCSADDIDAGLDELYAMGVRQVEIVNKFDNALTGVAGDGGTYGVITNFANRYETGHWLDMRTCVEADDHTMHAHDNPQINLIDDASSRLPGSEGRDQLLGGALSVFAGASGGAVAPVYPRTPHCNQRGLTPLGAHAVRRLIEKGMLFDPDHMSALGRQQALDILEEAGYSGVISSHGWSSEDAIPRIYALGGVVTPYAGDSTGFVRAWQAAKAVAASSTPAGVVFGFGYGADQNGLGGQGGPRNPPEDADVDYPFRGPLGDVTIDRQRSGERVYDINVDGVSHYGLYPDWLEDARTIAAERGDELIADMLRGPEAYLQMWERAEGVPPPSCVPPQAALDVDDIHAMLGARPVSVLRQLGQPSRREGFSFVYCTAASGGVGITTATFGTSGTLARVETRQATEAEIASLGRRDATASTPQALAADGHAGHRHGASVSAATGSGTTAAAHEHGGRNVPHGVAVLALAAVVLVLLRARRARLG